MSWLPFGRAKAGVKQITVNGMAVDVVRKSIRHMNLRVYPPDGVVRVAAPLRVSDDAVRTVVVERWDWIKHQQHRVSLQKPPAPRNAATEKEGRARLKELIPPLIARWEPIMGVEVMEWRVKRMKTKWGTCNTRARRIWISLELAHKPAHCLEYIVVHELTHLLERSHNHRFKALMDRFLPNWRAVRHELRETGCGE